MPSYLLKCAPDEDFYVYWSDVVEAPVAWGTRAEISEYMRTHTREAGSRGERFSRADAAGSSALWPSRSKPVYGWDSPCLIYEQRGTLPRASLRALCEALERGDEEAAWDLLKPFEDKDSVRRG